MTSFCYSEAMSENIRAITEPDVIAELAATAKKAHDDFFEVHMGNMFTINTEWCVDDNSEIANVFAHRLISVKETFNQIHHLQGVHELGLNPGWSRPDFYGNYSVASYQPTTMPASLEPYMGSELIFAQETPKETLPALGSLALRNDTYIAMVGVHWGTSKRQQDYEAHDRNHHLFFSVRVYFDPVA
jgi:hypothetical protein